MKTRRFDFNFKPLQLSLSFAVVDSVPDKQNYNGDFQEYTPDYTITPVIIQPTVAIMDKDEILTGGVINHKLANVRWYEIFKGVKTLITKANTSYEVTESGIEAGRIKVKKNAQPSAPITLHYYAEYTDERTGQLHIIQGSRCIKCTNASSLVTIEVDAAPLTLYNPLSDSRTQVITPTVRIGGVVCADPKKYNLQWEVYGEDGTWHVAGTDDFDYDVAVEKGSITVDKWLMGDSLYLRVRGNYSPEGAPGTTYTDDGPQATVSIARRIPAFEYDMIGVPYNIPPGTLRLMPTAVIYGTNGEIADAEKELLPLWYFAANKPQGALSYVLSGHGKDAVVDTTIMNKDYGGVLALDVVDRGPAEALTDARDSTVICDAEGTILIIH